MRRAWPFSNICLSPLWRKLVIIGLLYGDTCHMSNWGNRRSRLEVPHEKRDSVNCAIVLEERMLRPREMGAQKRARD